ncbi:GNAT family N-acetyltransferase [Shouchella shacheensis]|uniref:GNAT family N-acetyltransferase n=1 Tax=Shouchella shacheensis TaxID=1649580 RepID=UPI0007401095|nr:GNAT family N-acetyltransferase [Shouchella shacheensis]
MIEIFKVQQDASDVLKRQLAALFERQLHSIATRKAYLQVEQTIEQALEPHSRAHFFVVQMDGEAVAFAFFNVALSFEKGGNYIWLNELYVDESYRNQGIAKKLLLRIIYWAEQQKIKGIELETGMNNEATKALYNSLGFYDVVSKRYSFRF